MPIILPQNKQNFNAQFDSGYDKVYVGEYEVTPQVYAQTLKTTRRYLTKDINIKSIQYAEVSNQTGGKTVTIG